jgi:hypothetical protein
VVKQKPNQNLKRAQSPVGAGLPAMVVNDDAGVLNERGVLRFFAGKPAPTEKQLLPLLHHTQVGFQAAVLLILILLLI